MIKKIFCMHFLRLEEFFNRKKFYVHINQLDGDYCSGLDRFSQIFAQFGIIKHAYNPVFLYIFNNDKAPRPIKYVITLGRIAQWHVLRGISSKLPIILRLLFLHTWVHFVNTPFTSLIDIVDYQSFFPIHKSAFQASRIIYL